MKTLFLRSAIFTNTPLFDTGNNLQAVFTNTLKTKDQYIIIIIICKKKLLNLEFFKRSIT